MVTPLIAAFVVMCIIAGVTTEIAGYYNLAMLLGVVLSAIGGGLMTTLQPQASQSTWVGYQMLCGFGAGAGVAAPMLVIQTVLPAEHVPMRTAYLSLSQMLWSAVVVAIAQPIFEGQLRRNLSARVPGINVGAQLDSGARDLAKAYSPERLSTVILAQNDAVLKVFFIIPCLTA